MTRPQRSLQLTLSMVALSTMVVALESAPPARASDPDPAQLHARLLDGSSDRVLRRAAIPSERNYHGEARLIERGDAVVLQTLLDSARLRRGVQRMRKEELYRWPQGEPGAEDSARYLEDLEQSKDRVVEAFETRSDRGDRRMRMLIELVLAPEASFYAFYEVELADESESHASHAEAPRLLSKEAIVVRDASRTYLERALRLQSEAAFEGGLDELEESSR